MQAFVEQRLKNPKSADLQWSASEHVTNLGGGRYKVVAYVDATNTSGAVIRKHFYGVIKKVDDGWRLESLNIK